VVTHMEARASFFLHEIGSLEEKFLGGLIELLQHQVALLVGIFQETSDASTLPEHVLRKGCFTSYRVVWDPLIIFSFNVDQSMEHQVMMAFLEDKQSLGREDLPCPHFWVSPFCSRKDLCGLSMKKKGVKGGHLMPFSYGRLCI
jgi:hypothetical protein